MYVKNMFAKAIDRDIKGVIKVGQGDDENVRQELENMLLLENCRSILLTFSQAIRRE